MFLEAVLVRFCTLALHLHCGSFLGAVDGLWLLRSHGAGASHWQYGLCCICLSVPWPNCGTHLWFCTCLQQLEWRWKASHRRFVLAPACGNYSVNSISGCVSHIRASQPRSMWNVPSQHSSWNRSLLCPALDLDFWFSFGYSSGYRSGPRPRPRNRKCTC